MHFCTNCRAAHHGVVLKVTVPIKHLSFPLLPPQGGTDEGGMHSKKISLILQVPLVDNQSAEKWIDSRTGMGWGGHEPPLCYGSTQSSAYLQRKLSRSQSGGAGEQYTLVHTTVYLAPSPSATLAPPAPPPSSTGGLLGEATPPHNNNTAPN